jgi:hypothetical protein
VTRADVISLAVVVVVLALAAVVVLVLRDDPLPCTQIGGMPLFGSCP